MKISAITVFLVAKAVVAVDASCAEQSNLCNLSAYDGLMNFYCKKTCNRDCTQFTTTTTLKPCADVTPDCVNKVALCSIATFSALTTQVKEPTTNWCTNEKQANFRLCPAAITDNIDIVEQFLKSLYQMSDAGRKQEKTEEYLDHVFNAGLEGEPRTKVRGVIDVAKFNLNGKSVTYAEKWPFGMFEPFPAGISKAVFLIAASTPRWHPIYSKIAHSMNRTISNTIKTIDDALIDEAEGWKSGDLITLTTELGQTIKLAASCPKAAELSEAQHLLISYHNRHLHSAPDAERCTAWTDPNSAPVFSMMATLGCLTALFVAFDH
ncbi:hypothetical protein PRIPAC_97682 [Pristionchus pacificus]|uniref:Uncharacterized protein n=1 Tax=Pristionchus pacificus TaxID=54126 RepID=A0A2A6D315_PRIPA|nr:hypothetical protein PRIPAC_97682 [Pristionchus pacificus]|eukprot:PDM84681.1 hypothetical protein PRIPAC_33704 [Pristionchus pacificus]